MDISGDTFYSGKQDCFHFTRSDPICTGEDTREQMNINSAFIDGSALYGSDEKIAFKLRTGSDGLMKTHRLGPTLPTVWWEETPGPPPSPVSSLCNLCS